MKRYHRGWRRHHRRRMIRRAYSVFRCSELAVRLANHIKECSCVYCGNPRRWNTGKRTGSLAERRLEDRHGRTLQILEFETWGLASEWDDW